MFKEYDLSSGVSYSGEIMGYSGLVVPDIFSYDLLVNFDVVGNNLGRSFALGSINVFNFES